MNRVFAFCVVGILSANGAAGLVLQADVSLPLEGQQGQKFYSSKVSRVSNGPDAACLISTGTDWKSTAEARQAAPLAALRAAGASVSSALSETTPIDVYGLNSNTPYMMFAVDGAGLRFARVATGFNIDAQTLEIAYGANFSEIAADGVSVEARGDTALLTDPDALNALFDAFGAGQTLRVSAQSDKLVDASEHFMSYEFDGGFDADALSDCLADLSDPDEMLQVSRTPTFGIASVGDLDPSERAAVRGMACNRDLDPNGAELVRLNGPITGFASPLPYALVQRDDDGEIEHIWSGDLWRISRSGEGYALAFSNSVTSQGPLDPQLEKACTRFAQAECVSLGAVTGEDVDAGYAPGTLRVGACFDDFVAALPYASEGDPADPFGAAFGVPVAFSSAGQPSGLTQKSTSSNTSTSTTSTTTLTQIVSGDDPDPENPDTDTPGTTGVNAVPVPPAGILLLGGLALVFGLRRRA